MKLTTEQKREIERLIKSGNKIEAVKQFRNIADVGLAEAMAAINALESGAPVSARRDIAPKSLREAEQAAMAAIREGNVMEAIKRYRLHTKLGLKDSKDAIDALSLSHRTDGRVNAKVARSLIALVAAGQKQEAITMVMTNSGYDEAEARAIVKTIRKGGASCGGGCLSMILGLVLLAVLMGIGAWFLLRS